MNVRLIVVLVIVIVAAHVALIHLLLQTSSLDKEKEQLVEQTTEKKITPDEVEDAGPAPAPAPVSDTGSAEQPAETQPPAAKSFTTGLLRDMPELPPWRPLDYSKAVNGNIKGIPASSGVTAGILVDLNTRKVLWTKRAQRSYPIASMSKVMTMFLAYEFSHLPAYPEGLDTKIKVTREAALIPPSKVGLLEGETFSLRELMIASIVKSANDATWLIAQYFGGGNTSEFVRMMNVRAKELGMKSTVYHNPNGLPGKKKELDNISSAEDMVRISEAYMQCPELMQWCAMRVADFREPGKKFHQKIYNHNNLLPGARYGTPGVTGLKTGYTARAKFCVTASCTRNGRTLLAVVIGYPDQRGRDAFTKALLNWGFQQK